MIWLTILLRLKSALRAAVGVFRAYPLQCALIVLMVAYLWLLRAERRAVDALDAFKAETVAAQAKATANQVAVNHVPAILSKAVSERSNNEAPAYYAAVRAAADRVRVVRQSCSSAADLPGANHSAPLNDGPGLDPLMVSVPADEYNHFVDNTARLAKVRQDAQTLIVAGVAVKSTDGEE